MAQVDGEARYREEIERRAQLRDSLNLPFGLAVILGGLLAKMWTGRIGIDSPLPLAFWVLVIPSTYCFLRAVYGLVRSSHGHTYKGMPTALELAQYETELVEWHATYGEGRSAGRAAFRDWLDSQYVTAAHENWYVNTAKSEYLFQASRALIYCGILLALAYVPFAIVTGTRSEPTEVAVVSIPSGPPAARIPDEQPEAAAAPASEASPLEGAQRGSSAAEASTAQASPAKEIGSQLLIALFGAMLALVGQGIWHRYARARLGRGLATAFWEELSATRFYQEGGDRKFGGFTAQTFDSLFAAMSSALPASLARDLMRYHWRMKYLDRFQHRDGHVTDVAFYDEARTMWQDLRDRLASYSRREEGDLAWRPAESDR